MKHILIKHIKPKDLDNKNLVPVNFCSFIIQDLFKLKKENIIIAVGGPGGTGKTTFAHELKQRIHGSVVLSLDEYKMPRAVRLKHKIFGAHPKASNINMITQHLKKIKNDECFNIPQYSYDKGYANKTILFKPSKINIIEGEISTFSEFSGYIDFLIYIDSDWTTQLKTRITRDIRKKGYTKFKAIETFLNSNLIEFDRFCSEGKLRADIHIYCHDDYHHMIESINENIFRKYKDIIRNSFEELDISGLIVPVLTPFRNDLNIDIPSFIKELEYLHENGVNKIILNGTTGEFFSLTTEEKRLILKTARRYFQGIIIYQCCMNDLRSTIAESIYGQDYGADALICLPPFYISNLEKKGVEDYFNSVSQNIEIPFLLYNFPKHTQNLIDKEMLKNIDHFGIKDSSKDFSLIEHTPRYFYGGSSQILDAHLKGSVGFVCAHANLFTKFHVDIENQLKLSDHDAAQNTQKKLKQISFLVSGIKLIPMLKYGLSKKIIGFKKDVRLPLTNITNKEVDIMERFDFN